MLDCISRGALRSFQFNGVSAGERRPQASLQREQLAVGLLVAEFNVLRLFPAVHDRVAAVRHQTYAASGLQRTRYDGDAFPSASGEQIRIGELTIEHGWM